jgi:hypothetical protein
MCQKTVTHLQRLLQVHELHLGHAGGNVLPSKHRATARAVLQNPAQQREHAAGQEVHMWIDRDRNAELKGVALKVLPTMPVASAGVVIPTARALWCCLQHLPCCHPKWL